MLSINHPQRKAESIFCFSLETHRGKVGTRTHSHKGKLFSHGFSLANHSDSITWTKNEWGNLPGPSVCPLPSGQSTEPSAAPGAPPQLPPDQPEAPPNTSWNLLRSRILTGLLDLYTHHHRVPLPTCLFTLLDQLHWERIRLPGGRNGSAHRETTGCSCRAAATDAWTGTHSRRVSAVTMGQLRVRLRGRRLSERWPALLRAGRSDQQLWF